MEKLETIYYDGHCGLCHRGVLFVLRHDSQSQFRFAPLEGETFIADVSAEDRGRLPDSMAVRTRDGKLLTRTAAWLYILRRMGNGWRLLSIVLGWVPLCLGNLIYDWVARVRRKLFRQPEDVCPIVPAALRSRFVA
jgi:predicted DCC family thiol-disulfide oxidoreductase YuxK